MKEKKFLHWNMHMYMCNVHLSIRELKIAVVGVFKRLINLSCLKLKNKKVK